ncbi:MAG: trypsin-like peptidase domain-containing protein [Bdellovibrio sp.]|nr:trypsin-like peptidase domain-containing protein [Bdellovibrio sp.]
MRSRSVTGLTISLILGLSCTSMAKDLTSDKVIYGTDNRQDLKESSLVDFQKLALSTAVQIKPKYFTVLENGNLQLKADETLKAQYDVCDDEPFAQQLAVGNCSGFLVSSDLLVTAGHCMDSESDCEDFIWAFDYAEGKIKDAQIVKENVYRCKKILKQSLDETSMNDYAVIQLDRPVTNRAPLNFRLNGSVKVGDSLVVIGHPSGLPTKIAGGATVQQIDHPAYFQADLDTYGGNSGSAVFNTKTGEVEGILVRGAKDYVYNLEKGCLESNRCEKMDKENKTCEGESVSRISAVEIIALEREELVKQEPSLVPALADVSFADNKGESLLTAAAKYAKYPLVRDLVQNAKVELNKKNSQRDTALHLAIKANDYYTTKLLLEKGADFTIKGKEKLKAKKLVKKLNRDPRFRQLMVKYDKWYLPGKH